MGPKPRLLIADDERDILETLVDDFSELGFDVVTAGDGEHAFSIIQGATPKEPVDAVLSDINMPKLDGLSLLEKVRKLKLDTPFVYITGYADKEKAIRALRLGALDFIEKPFDRKRLKQIVSNAVSFGVQIRNLDRDLDEMFKATNPSPSLSPDERDRQRDALKAILLMKRHATVMKK